MSNDQAQLTKAAKNIHRALTELKKTQPDSVASFTLAGSLVRSPGMGEYITFSVSEGLTESQIKDRLIRHPLWRNRTR